MTPRRLRPDSWLFALALVGCGTDPSGDGGSDGGPGEGTGHGAGTDDTGADTDHAGTTAATTEQTSGADESGSESGPTYADDVAPILKARCWSCHVEGGFAPFPMVDYDDVEALGPAIVGVTESRQMPPWPLDGSGDCQEFVDPRYLAEDEIATLRAWLDAGSRPGDLALVPTPTPPPTLGDISASIAVPTYTPSGDPPDHPFDDYRCFVVDPQLANDTILSAFEVHPTAIEQAHHIVLFSLDSDTAVSEAMALDQQDPQPGYTCFGAAGVAQSRILGAWTPGVPVVRFPQGTGVRLPGGRPLVIQMHYNLGAVGTPDMTAIDLQFDPAAEPLESIVIVDTDLTIPAETASHTEGTSWTYDGPVAIELMAVFPHMHQIGKQLGVTVEGAGGSTCAVDVPRYDFHWQELYRYVTPVRVEPGDSVALECTFNSTGRDSVTHFGEGSADEMCAAQFFVRAAD